MSDDNDVERIEVGDDLYILALSGSSRGGDQMRKQAEEAMERVRGQSESGRTNASEATE
jgi:hypothetical protein